MNRYRKPLSSAKRAPKLAIDRALAVFLCLVLCAATILSAGCAESAVATQSDAVSSDPPSPTPQPSADIPTRPAAIAMTTIGDPGESEPIEGFGIESVINEDAEGLTIAAHYPVTDREVIDAQLKKESESEVEQFRQLVSTLPASEARASYEFNRDFDSHVWSDSTDATSGRIVSFLFRSKMQLDKPVPNMVLKSFIFDIQEDKELQFVDLIDADKLQSGEFYAFISQKSKEKLKSQPTNGPDWDDTTLDEGLKPVKERFDHYYLDGQDLVFVFDVYQLGPYSLGTPVVRFDYSEFRDYLSDLGKTILDEAAKVKATPDPSTEIAQTDKPTPSKKPNVKLEADGKYIALTFDDGPHNKLTPRLLDLLKKYDAKATFFVLGNRLGYAKDIVKRIADEGHEIGNHSNSHKDLTKMSASEIAAEMDPTDEILESIIGQKTTVMRPPYGAINDNVKKYAQDKGLPIIMWKIDPEDWKYRDGKVVARTIIDSVSPGDVVLLHDIHETSVDAAEIVLKELTDKGYQFVTVSELNPDMKAGESYRRIVK